MRLVSKALVFFISYSSVFAFGQDFLSSQDLKKTCILKFGNQVLDFEKKNKVDFGLAVDATLRGNKVKIKSDEVRGFCNSILGKNYGLVEFFSSPRGALIFVDGDEQVKPTNSKFHFTTGRHNWEIRFPDNKKCLGIVDVDTEKVANISIRKKDCAQ